MSTILLHTARAITPAAEIPDAGILLRDDVIEAIGPREGISLPAGKQGTNTKRTILVPRFWKLKTNSI